MAKTFYTSGTGSQQTLTGSQDEKVAVYQTLADAEADLANLEAGQIVATPDTGDENAQPVDVVESGNMHSVTSGAVYTALSNKANIQGSEFTSSMAGAIQYHTNFYAPDLNTLTASGFFSVNIVNASSSHAPITGGATLIVCRFNDAKEALSQTITYLSNISYTRTCNGGTWSAWQKLIRTSDLTSFIKYKEVSINSITIGNLGYTDMRSYFPSGMNNFMFCLLYNFGTNTGAHSFDINADGRYMRGTPNDVIDNVVLRYYYTD